MRALIVDDSRFIREYLKQVVEPMNVVCEQAVDGRDALRVLESSAPFDLMFCDLNMPVMNGLECVKALRASGQHRAMRVVMVTTETDYDLIERALDLGADEFLMKPFTPDSLREKLMLLDVYRSR